MMRLHLLTATLLLLSACSSSSPSGSDTHAPQDTASPTDTAPTSDTAAPADTMGELPAPVDATDDTGAADDTAAVKDTAPSDVVCLCPPDQHCTPEGTCADDVCIEGVTTCHEDGSVQVCYADGSGFDLTPCAAGTTCYLGECVEKICEPASPITCEGGQLKSCNSLGTAWVLTPCPGGTACADGACAPIQPNVILILDTSGSMNWVDAVGMSADACEGDGCPAWSWPTNCEDPKNPATRLGKAKLALQTIVTSETAQGARIALQRFPQNMNLLLGGKATCSNGGLLGLTSWTGPKEHESHQIPEEKILGPGIGLIMPVPFGDTDASAVEEIVSWIDFEETYEKNEKTCTLLPIGCPGDTPACLDGQCAEQTAPELRAVGESPLGRSLFYAGEVLRHQVVVEGRACAQDADCGSPHYTCVEGLCHDPYRACRPNLIIVFTDGGETVDTWAEIKESSAAFFNPRVQAKRLHFGLGCATDADCLNGATCTQGVCTTDTLSLAPKHCHLTDVPCTTNGECSEYKYKCGPAQTCSGECEETGLGFVDTKAGQEVIRDPAGTPISATIHVVDASESITPNSLIAALGGGQHVPVKFEDLPSLIDAFLPLFDVKAAVSACE